MKKIIIMLIIWVIIPINAVSQCKLNVDSLFHSYFFSLDTTMQCGTSSPVALKDFRFVRLIAELSKIEYTIHSYSGNPLLTIQEVLVYKKWYWKNKNKIDCKEVEKLLSSYQKEWEDIILEQLIDIKVDNHQEALEKLKDNRK